MGMTSSLMLDYIPMILMVSDSTFQTFFNTVFSSATDPPNIINLTYDEESRSLICVSTRSPATVVSWMKDGDIIDESSTDYTLTQTVTDRATSTYSNVLTIRMGASEVGTYICTVSNELGSDSEEVVTLGELMVDVISPFHDVDFLSQVSLSLVFL